MKIILCDIREDIVFNWNKYFKGMASVSIVHGSIFEQIADAFVSPANSFGFMDGGIDYFYSMFFGWDVQKTLQNIIKNKPLGELLVGEAELIETNHPVIPYIISAPTMRVPWVLHRTVNVYLATKAAVMLAKKHELKSIVFPGMGTGCGELSPTICAKQMRSGIQDALTGPMFPDSWNIAQFIQNRLVVE